MHGEGLAARLCKHSIDKLLLEQKDLNKSVNTYISGANCVCEDLVCLCDFPRSGFGIEEEDETTAKAYRTTFKVHITQKSRRIKQTPSREERLWLTNAAIRRRTILEYFNSNQVDIFEWAFGYWKRKTVINECSKLDQVVRAVDLRYSST
jgi:hypothetical protein